MGLINQNKRNQSGGEAAKKASFVKLNSSSPNFANHKASCNQELLFDLADFCQLKQLLLDNDVSEVMVNGPNQVYCERKGKLILTSIQFHDNKHVIRLIEKMIAPLGRRIDESSPMVDATLPDGSHVNAIIPPLAINGPAITIRKISKESYKMNDLINFGTVTEDIAVFLNACVKARLNLFLSGGTGSGKTTTLNALKSFIPKGERLIAIEEKEKAATDHIMVDEIRGEEAFDLLQALNTCNTGALAAGHSNCPRDMITRLETMVHIARVDLEVRATRNLIAKALDVIIHQTRLTDGSRKIISIAEVLGVEGDRILLQEIFTFKQEGINREGKIIGRLVPTGVRPKFYKQLEATGISMPTSLFH
ncbi:CpaF family protein [Bacillus sp. UNC438CL73TsuS30]|uniref:CpaF family protein n=1 Tax=Bacillus sp. UNC438CL73TsuS30 TaxID=1340434 RepID=UPI0006917F50|nr:ATPase, T2SS/T4P/T4SS family [Bacillus sp. UNC438CL73TsuS30]